MIASTPRGVTAAGIGSAINGIAINASNTYLCSLLTFTFDITRRYRVWYVIRAITAGFINFGLYSPTLGGSIGGDQWMSADRSYGGATFTWLISGVGGAIQFAPRVSTNYLTGVTVYGRDFYVEDVGAA